MIFSEQFRWWRSTNGHHAMTCTRCKHNREIARLAEEQARLRGICSQCHLGEGVAGGGRVSLDAIQDGTVARIVKAAPTHAPFDPGEIDEPPREPDAETQTRDTLQTLLACVAALPYEQVTRLVQVADTFRTLNRRRSPRPDQADRFRQGEGPVQGSSGFPGLGARQGRVFITFAKKYQK